MSASQLFYATAPSFSSINFLSNIYWRDAVDDLYIRLSLIVLYSNEKIETKDKWQTEWIVPVFQSTEKSEIYIFFFCQSESY